MIRKWIEVFASELMSLGADSIDDLSEDAQFALRAQGLLNIDESEVPETMLNNVGKIVYYNWTLRRRYEALDVPYRIVGIQKNWKGELCYRVVNTTYNDTFGRAASPDKLEFPS